MSNEELNKYIVDISDQSEVFKKFLHDYVTGSTWIRSRGEEDVSVWRKLEGKEFEVAKHIIIEELNIVTDSSYIRAVSYFRDPQAIPALKKIIDTLPERFFGEKLLAAKVLYDWIGYEPYLNMLESACRNSKGMAYDYLRIAFNEFTRNLSKEKIEEFSAMLKTNVNR